MLQQLLIRGQRLVCVPSRNGNTRAAGLREWMAGKRMLRPGKVARRTVDIAFLQTEVANLRVNPRDGLRVLGPGGFGGHPHAGDCGVEMPLQLLCIRDAGVSGSVGPVTCHRVERGKRLVVLAELDVRVADDPVVPGVLGMHLHRACRHVHGLAEAML